MGLCTLVDVRRTGQKQMIEYKLVLVAILYMIKLYLHLLRSKALRVGTDLQQDR